YDYCSDNFNHGDQSDIRILSDVQTGCRKRRSVAAVLVLKHRCEPHWHLNKQALPPASSSTTSCLRSAGLCSFSGKFDRILLKVMLQFRVQSWVASAKHYRPLKKSLDRHREKFGWIRRAISIEQCRNAGFISSAERCKLSSHHFAPGQLLPARRQRRRAIGR